MQFTDFRCAGAIDPLMHKYNASIGYDKALYKEDILGSIAFARANLKAGIITEAEFQEIERGLREVMEEWKNGTFAIMPNDEDVRVHTMLPNLSRLIQRTRFILQTNVDWERSLARTSQVSCTQVAAATSKLSAICACGCGTESAKSTVNSSLSSRSSSPVPSLKCKSRLISGQKRPLLTDNLSDYLMPGYTHLQRAQPVRWSQWLMSYAAAFKQDLERLRQVYERVNLSPLGCGALAGNPFKIDRNMIAEELGFSGITMNSMNTSADRDFIIEFLVWNSVFANHVSRWAEDLIIYATSEFSFVRLADAYSTGSSLMPNKHNADSLELLRGKSGRAFGQMAGLMMVSYHIESQPVPSGLRGARSVTSVVTDCSLFRP